jgi:ERCC4-related helicase
LVEHLTVNQNVPGSSPGGSANSFGINLIIEMSLLKKEQKEDLKNYLSKKDKEKIDAHIEDLFKRKKRMRKRKFLNRFNCIKSKLKLFLF